MKLTPNQILAREIFSEWPDWKKEIYSTKPLEKDVRPEKQIIFEKINANIDFHRALSIKGIENNDRVVEMYHQGAIAALETLRDELCGS